MKKLMAFVLSFLFMMCLGGCSKESASVGIIGGADGPTAIFVTSKIHWPGVCIIGITVAAILVALITYCNKKRNDKSD